MIPNHLRQRCNRLFRDALDGLNGLIGALTYYLTRIPHPFLLAVALAYLIFSIGLWFVYGDLKNLISSVIWSGVLLTWWELLRLRGKIMELRSLSYHAGVLYTRRIVSIEARWAHADAEISTLSRRLGRLEADMQAVPHQIAAALDPPVQPQHPTPYRRTL